MFLWHVHHVYTHTCFIYRLEVLSSPLPESEAGQDTHRYAAFHTSDRVYHTYIVRVPDVAVISVGMNHEARSLKARLVLVLLLHAFRCVTVKKKENSTYNILYLCIMPYLVLVCAMCINNKPSLDAPSGLGPS